MARPYSQDFLVSLQSADERQIGVQLARLCVDANVPASYIATALDTTRMTVYSWFRGQDIRRKKRKTVEALVDLMKQDFESGILPALNRKAARAYVENLIGSPIPTATKMKRTETVGEAP